MLRWVKDVQEKSVNGDGFCGSTGCCGWEQGVKAISDGFVWVRVVVFK